MVRVLTIKTNKMRNIFVSESMSLGENFDADLMDKRQAAN